LRLEVAVSWASSEERNSTATDHLSIPTTVYLQFLGVLMHDHLDETRLGLLLVLRVSLQ